MALIAVIAKNASMVHVFLKCQRIKSESVAIWMRPAVRCMESVRLVMTDVVRKLAVLANTGTRYHADVKANASEVKGVAVATVLIRLVRNRAMNSMK